MTKSSKAACVALALGMVTFGATTAEAQAMRRPPRGEAPSPEVNTLVGFLVVAGTVVFIKRRRGTKAKAEDATA